VCRAPFSFVLPGVWLPTSLVDLLLSSIGVLPCGPGHPAFCLRSAPEPSGFVNKIQTMGTLFCSNIFHALVGLFAGIAMLDRLGVPVSGLLTGAGVAGLAVSLAAQSTLNNLIVGITLAVGAALRHRGLHRAWRLRGHC